MKLTKKETDHLNKVIDTALRALPLIIKEEKRKEVKEEIREHRDVLLQIKFKIKDNG